MTLVAVSPMRLVDPTLPSDQLEARARKETPQERAARVARQNMRSSDADFWRYMERLTKEDDSIRQLVELATLCEAIKPRRFFVADEDALVDAIMGGTA